MSGWLTRLETFIVRDPKLLLTFVSYVLVLLVYINSTAVQSLFLGLLASILYFLINGTFLGRTFFGKEDAFFRLMLGILLLVMLLGFVGWLAVIIYNLDVLMLTLVLLITSTISSFLNKKVKHESVTQ